MPKKFLFQPVSPFIINQRFGENKACIPIAGDPKLITCDGNNPPEGYKSVYGPNGHLGLDLATNHGQPVFCAQDGVVTFIDANPQSGLDVRIEVNFEGHKYLCIYEHLLGYQPQVGDKVQVGQVIGWADNTGWSSGDHLHFQVEKDGVPVDPLPLMYEASAQVGLAAQDTITYLKEQVALLAEKIADFLRSR